MNTAHIREEDIVKLNVRGDVFYGLVTMALHVSPTKQRQLRVRPIGNGRGEVRAVTPRQITAHYRKSKASRG